ncbi:MAG: hypothetical protein R3E68_11755 [Burkholderiaceae bacterium]
MCATTDNLAAIEPPDGAFHELSCEQLLARQQLTHEQMRLIGQPIDDSAMGNRVAMGAGVVFWPALYLVQGERPEHATYSRLKGESQRLASLQTLRGCPVQAPIREAPSAQPMNGWRKPHDP